jgi:hypothetical protein
MCQRHDAETEWVIVDIMCAFCAVRNDSCISEYRFPAGCDGSQCDYTAKWKYSPTTHDIRFEISARDPTRWTGIGFSRDGMMVSVMLGAR